MKKQHLFLLAFLTLIGFLLRTWQLSTLPSILNRDEAALAYNAFLIEKTGQDEFGRNFPLTFESFGDYKLPGYIYTLSLIFKVFPTTDFYVRLPSAFAGALLIPIVFFLGKQLNLNKEKSLIFALVVAINPVFWFYSRIAFEANVALTLFTLALAFFLQQKPHFKSDAAGLFFTILAILFYNTPLLLLPFFSLAIIVRRGIKKINLWLPLTISLAVIFIGFYLQLNNLTAQKKGITWFNDETTWDQSVKHYNQFSGFSQKLLGNKFVFYGGKILTALSQSFTPQFLVTTGGTHPWHTMPNWGHLYWPTYIFGLVGIFYLIKKIRTHAYFSNLILVIFSLIPSIITVDSPHATRSLIFFVLFGWLAVFTLEQTTGKIGKLITSGFVVSQIVFAFIYGYHYFVLFPKNQPLSLMNGFNTKIIEVESIAKTKDEKVAIVDESGYQYILTAWYLKLEPNYFFESVIKQLPNKIGFKYGQQVGRYHFIAKSTDRVSTETILLEWKDNLWQIH